MPKHVVTVNLSIGVNDEALMALVANLSKPDLGMHMLNTLTNHAHLPEAQFRGISLDMDHPASNG